MKNELKLTVTGKPKSGKTNLIKFIAAKLAEAGCEVEIVNTDGSEKHPLKSDVLKNLKVSITENWNKPNDNLLFKAAAFELISSGKVTGMETLFDNFESLRGKSPWAILESMGKFAAIDAMRSIREEVAQYEG